MFSQLLTETRYCLKKTNVLFERYDYIKEDKSSLDFKRKKQGDGNKSKTSPVLKNNTYLFRNPIVLFSSKYMINVKVTKCDYLLLNII